MTPFPRPIRERSGVSPSADPRPRCERRDESPLRRPGGEARRRRHQSLVALVSALADDDRFEPVVTVPRPGALSEALDTRSIPWRVVRTPAWVAYTDPERSLSTFPPGHDPGAPVGGRHARHSRVGRAPPAGASGGRGDDHGGDPHARDRVSPLAYASRVVAARADEPSFRELVRTGGRVQSTRDRPALAARAHGLAHGRDALLAADRGQEAARGVPRHRDAADARQRGRTGDACASCHSGG